MRNLQPMPGEPCYVIKRDEVSRWWAVYYREPGTTAWVYVKDSLRLFKFNARRVLQRMTDAEYYDKYGYRTW